MPSVKKIIECVPNFSEGRNSEKIEKIVEPFRAKEGVKLLDYQKDDDHNRLVVTVVGEPDALKTAVIEAMGCAIDVIDMRTHQGQHPRMGATDVVPFIPIKNVSMEEAVEFSKSVAKAVAKKYSLPIFLYEKSASRPARQNLANIRKGQFEGMADKIKQPEWKPDFGPQKIHPSAGVAAMGARMPLVAYNVNLDSNKSMNMTDYTRTALYRAFELIKAEARRYGVNIVGSEIVGLVPMEALMDTAAYYLGLENFSMEQVLEARIWE
jgi:glutamate formiminotransferase